MHRFSKFSKGFVPPSISFLHHGALLSFQATLAWVPHEGRPIVFTKATNKWSHAELSYTQVGWLMVGMVVGMA